MAASPFNRPAWLIVIGSCLVSAVAFLPIDNAAQLPPLPEATQSALNNISADSLRGNLSFLASDALKGRFTPSPELNVAAEFIASDSGLGFLINDARTFFLVSNMLLGAAVIGIIGVLANVGLRRLEGHLLRWRRDSRGRA